MRKPMKSYAASMFAGLLLTSTGAFAATPCAQLIPFGIAARKPPAGTLVAQVLPARVGRFVRDAVAANAAIPSDEDFNVTYRAGKDSVFIGLSRGGTPADLKQAIRTSRQDVVSDKSIDRRGELYCEASAPFFYKIPDFIAWTRGPYFLYADASSAAVLDEFMRAFLY
jgi:hypothetical protein